MERSWICRHGRHGSAMLAAVAGACCGLASIGGEAQDAVVPASASFSPPPLPVVTDLSRRKVAHYRDDEPQANRAEAVAPLVAPEVVVAPSASVELPYANVLSDSATASPARPMVSAASPRAEVERRITILPPPIERRQVVVAAPTSPVATVDVMTPAREWPAPPVQSAVAIPVNRTMQAIAARADQCNRRGFELANKGALYSARVEFIKALRLLAQSLDAEAETPRRGDALVNGLLALEESDDFLDRGMPVDHRIDVPAIVATHRTVVLKENSGKGLTPLAALTRYYSFAQEQLAVAVDHEPTGSVSLYGLGKVYSTLTAADPVATVAGGPKAIAMHQAALAVDPRNALAAHELGVLLARCGQFDGARAALAHSAAQESRPETWRNLGIVLEQLGDHTAAAQARQQAAVASGQPVRVSSGTGSPQQPLVWLEPGQFATTSVPQAEASVGARPVSRSVAPPQSPPQTGGQKSGFPWPIRMGAR